MPSIASCPLRRSALPRALTYAAVAVIAAAPATAEHADAATASCGMVVQDQLVLDRDLRCPGPALIVRNPRSVVQLNGHTIESAKPCRDGSVASRPASRWTAPTKCSCATFA